jgi:sterol desaturase/sphingolipid hydroxylase (fatty acid hydroxylase superfamily)
MSSSSTVLPAAGVESVRNNRWFRRIYSDELLATVDRWEGINAKPHAESRKKREGIRIFRDTIVEKLFSKAHPVMPIVWTAPFMALGFYRGVIEGRSGGLGTLGLFLVGVVIWSFLEYLLHRGLFHWEFKGPEGKMLSFMLHGYHHEFPDDRMRLVAPPLMLFALGVVVGFLHYVVFGAQYWAQVFAGTTVGYVAYDWIHYYTHHFHPRAGLGSWLRRYHLRHHFQEEKTRYGISSPLWDHVFRTYRSPNH